MWTKSLVCAVAAVSVLGQLVMKRAVISLGGAPASLSLVPRFIVEAVKSPWIYGSLAIQGTSYFLWMILISKVKLGIAAASVGAAFYLLIALSAWWVYGETITALQWVGIIFIAMGVACIAFRPA